MLGCLNNISFTPKINEYDAKRTRLLLSSKDKVQQINTITCRYKQFERERNSFNSTNNNNEKTEKNQKASNSNQSFDFGSRINKLRFIDDSASSTALTSPAESLSHFHFGQRQQQQQHLFLKSNNYKNSGSHVEPTSTDTSRTVSLSASTNPSSCCSTPIGSINKRQGLTNNITKINQNIKLSTEKVEKCKSDENNRSSISSTSSFSNKLQNMQLQHENLDICYSKGIIVIYFGSSRGSGMEFCLNAASIDLALVNRFYYLHLLYISVT